MNPWLNDDIHSTYRIIFCAYSREIFWPEAIKIEKIKELSVGLPAGKNAIKFSGNKIIMLIYYSKMGI